MLLLVLGLLLGSVIAQSLVPVPGINADPSNSCLKRSVFVYTSASATYVVTDLGTTSITTEPSFCSNATTLTSTIYGSVPISTLTIPGINETVTTALPASTVTIIQQSPSTPLPVTNQTINFDAGSPTYDVSSSAPQVSAVVADGGPLQPYSGDNYLLVAVKYLPRGSPLTMSD